MRNSKQCPKCRSDDILRIPGWVGGYGTGNNIPVKTFAWTSGGNVLVARYLCCSCGFSEEWIEGEEEIASLRKRYGPQ